MDTPTYTLEIIDDGTLDTVVLCAASELERFFRYPLGLSATARIIASLLRMTLRF